MYSYHRYPHERQITNKIGKYGETLKIINIQFKFDRIRKLNLANLSDAGQPVSMPGWDKNNSAGGRSQQLH